MVFSRVSGCYPCLKTSHPRGITQNNYLEPKSIDAEFKKSSSPVTKQIPILTKGVGLVNFFNGISILMQ